MSYVSRDPFARTEIHKEEVCGEKGCAWCGSTNRRGNLFVYRTESDGGRKSEHKGEFCSKACHDSFHS